jgi:hypothetical protein
VGLVNELPPLPRWFLLLPLLAVATWWPLDPYWQSDDYLALHYAQDLRRALADFAGPQYGSSDIWLFYRPLITLSFWVDALVGGGDPFAAHLGNVVAHGISTLLAALVWRRFLTEPGAFCAALLWALLPSHAGSIAWAVGRVDSHTTVWCLLSLWLALRHAERRAAGERTRPWPMLLATAAALASKELAFVVPPLATALVALRAGGSARERLRAAAVASWPLWALFLCYLPLRWILLGRFGGYLGAHYDVPAMATGLLQIVANLLVPLRWCGGSGVWLWLAAVPAVLAVAAGLRAPRRLLAAVGLFGLAAAPMAGFFADAQNVHSLRYFYLPSIALVGLFAAAGRLVVGLAVLAVLPALVEMRTVQRAADRESAAMHQALLREVHDGAPSPLFVAGLPHGNTAGSVVQLHFGVDRMLEPPFGPGGAQLYALRPLLGAIPGVLQLAADDDVPFPLPAGSTWFFADATALGRVPTGPAALPDLPITGDTDGVLDLSSARLLQMAEQARSLWDARAPSFGLRTPGVRPVGYRVTIFTANGYLCCLCFDHGLGGPGEGSLDMLRFFADDPVAGSKAAITGLLGTRVVGEDITVPTVIDRVPEFPVLLEAGWMAGAQFVPSHRARRLLTFRFDRGYAAWARLVQGRG